jgi:hypothetical protein
MPVLMLISYPWSCLCDICLSQPFLLVFLLCHALGQIRTDPAEGGGVAAACAFAFASGRDDMAFFKILCITPQTLSFYFFSPSYSYFLLFFCVLFVVAHCVYVCPFSLNQQIFTS